VLIVRVARLLLRLTRRLGSLHLAPVLARRQYTRLRAA
jgi:hypothetical protein